jgi:hypothetical protein
MQHHQHEHAPRQRPQTLLPVQKQEQSRRFWWVLLIILAALGAIYFYLIPFLSSAGVGGQGGPVSTGWTTAHQRHIAFDLAQNVQDYRQRIHERREINYGDAYLQVTGIAQPFRPKQPYPGMDAPNPPEHDTHSEHMLKGWGLYTIRNSLHNVPAGSTINMLIFTQVKVCPPCRKAIQTWAKQLQQTAPAGVSVNLSIWQQTSFDIKHPDQTPVRSANEVECAVSSSAS